MEAGPTSDTLCVFMPDILDNVQNFSDKYDNIPSSELLKYEMKEELNPVRCSSTFLMEFLQLLSPQSSVPVTVTNLMTNVNIVSYRGNLYLFVYFLK
jgi:hypothetical protein